MSTILADSGMPEDVQMAIDAAIMSGDAEVQIPAGAFPFDFNGGNTISFTPPPQGLTIRGMGSGITILENVTSPLITGGGVLFEAIDESLPRTRGFVRFTGITFKGIVDFDDDVASNPNTVGVRMRGVREYRVDHCGFSDFSSIAISHNNTRFVPGSHGVIDHNIIDQPYKEIFGGKWGYGVVATAGVTFGAYAHPDPLYYLGKYDGVDDVVYIEDNLFRRCRHQIASNQNAWYVARYNEFHDPRPVQFGQVDVHGSAGPNAAGGRGLEAYNNHFVGYQLPDGRWLGEAFLIRGGAAFIYNNTFENILNQGVSFAVVTTNPAFTFPRDVYIWGNDWSNVTTPINIVNPGTVVEGVNYFLQEFPYTPYPYPHPLVTEAPLKRLTVNSNLSSVPFNIRRV